MAFSGDVGLEIHLQRVPRSEIIQRDDHILFSESNSRFLVEVPADRRDEFERIMDGAIYSLIGRTRRERKLLIYGLNGSRIVNADLSRLMYFWKKTLGG
ncbi:hypothetical protein DRO64_07180 [Candidatus Bathyarchaeota archaeon]|nr:MAG: hypothetical protein DRO64_07180 [Candidatus Bathyarchaeota archaeon]